MTQNKLQSSTASPHKKAATLPPVQATPVLLLVPIRHSVSVPSSGLGTFSLVDVGFGVRRIQFLFWFLVTGWNGGFYFPAPYSDWVLVLVLVLTGWNGIGSFYLPAPYSAWAPPPPPTPGPKDASPV